MYMLDTARVAVICALCMSLAYSLPLKAPNNNIRVSKRSISEGEAIEHVVTAGHDIELECDASGSTPPIIQWLFNDERIEQSPLDARSENVIAPGIGQQHPEGGYSTVSTLRIKSASSSDAGVYKCVADLPDSKASQAYNVQVSTPTESDQIAAVLKRGSTSDDDARIYLYTSSVFEQEGVSTRIICRATQGAAKSPPAITWTINGETITSQTPNYELVANGDLKILRTTAAHHFADIRCSAVGDNRTFDEKSPFIYIFKP